MAYSHLIRKLTDRGAVRGARRLVECLVVMALGVNLMAAAALFPMPAMAQGNATERVKVLVEDVTESTAADLPAARRGESPWPETASRPVCRGKEGSSSRA